MCPAVQSSAMLSSPQCVWWPGSLKNLQVTYLSGACGFSSFGFPNPKCSQVLCCHLCNFSSGACEVGSTSLCPGSNVPFFSIPPKEASWALLTSFCFTRRVLKCRLIATLLRVSRARPRIAYADRCLRQPQPARPAQCCQSTGTGMCEVKDRRKVKS